MKILATSDWHLGNLFHSIDRLPEHNHFLHWLQEMIASLCPDVLLVAGDVFDNGNPSAAAQELYYAFLADVTAQNPDLHIVITAGNHDSAYRLEAPRTLLRRHHIEVRGVVHRLWQTSDECPEGRWTIDLDDMIVPVTLSDGRQLVVLAIPFLRPDVLHGYSYSSAVNQLLSDVTKLAKKKYPDVPCVMMAHMYAAGADIAKDSSERIVIGGQEQVSMEGLSAEHPDYFTCGHIHKRQHIWNTDWARYSGSVLPMSFAECEYHHGVDLIEVEAGQKPQVTFVEYEPQHKLLSLPMEGAAELKELKKLIAKLDDRNDGQLDEHSVYLELKLLSSQVRPEDRKALEEAVSKKNAVICRLQQVMPDADIQTILGQQQIQSVEDVINRDPFDAIQECFTVKTGDRLSPDQEKLVRDVLSRIDVHQAKIY